MSPFSFYEGTVTHARGALKTILELVDKLDAHAASANVSAESLLQARLAPDMLPFIFQTHVVCDSANKMAARVMGEEPAAIGAWDEVKTTDGIRARANRVLATLDAIDAAKWNERADTTVTFGMGPGKDASAKAYGYANGYSLPNVFFHTTTAYAILRKEGIDVGKGNYQPNFLNPYLL
jgi:hypothetical protein